MTGANSVGALPWGAQHERRVMKPCIAFLLSLLIISPAQARFEAHEWGTFTSLVGSDGVSQHGLYHEDEKLPDFVHGFGETQSAPFNPIFVPPTPNNEPCLFKGCFSMNTFQNNVITQKMETPVIYFYGTPSSLDRRVQVKVDFPDGVITETFPAPISSSPKMSSDFVSIRNGTATFDVKVSAETEGKVPYVDGGNIYGHARKTMSQVVSTNNEFEKFIFYRGIGRFQPRVSITSDSLDLRILAKGVDVPSALFLIAVNEQGYTQMLPVPRSRVESKEGFRISSRYLQQMSENKPASIPQLLVDSATIRSHLVQALVAAGLKTDESEAMIKTWEHGYLKTPGLRLLYVVPRSEVDRLLPLAITPAPDALERAFMARIEVMPRYQEEQLIYRIENEGERFDVASLGRFAEPRLRRVQQVYAEKGDVRPDVKRAIENLIQKSTLFAESTPSTIQ